VIRSALGGFVAFALGTNGQVAAFGAIVAGMSAPAIMEKWRQSAKAVTIPEQTNASKTELQMENRADLITGGSNE
jgi:hypothetical protein